MSEEVVKTRFAPSPTGYLHVGGARTALFSWLFARKNNGIFVLRIEDTDVERSTQEAVQAILDGMNWLGLNWDEGPYFQSKRIYIYQKYAKQLLDEGKAYEAVGRKNDIIENSKQKNTTHSSNAVFFKSTSEKVEDFVIMKSDGMPTYHFAVVIDDWLMGITHVIRGDDHLVNTGKHVMLYDALDVQKPKFVHVPMILGGDGQRLSKRHGATSVLAYKEQGYLPEAMINYLARLGWAYKDQEIFSITELIEKFSTNKVGKSAAVFDSQKLEWLNGHYLQIIDSKRLIQIINTDYDWQLEVSEHNVKIIELLKTRAKTIPEMFNSLKYFLMDQIIYQSEAVEDYLGSNNANILLELQKGLAEIIQWDEAEIEKVIRNIANEQGVKASGVIHPLRVAITGSTASPGIFETVKLIGKDRVIYRLKNLPTI